MPSRNAVSKYLSQAERHNTFTVAQLRDINGIVAAAATTVGAVTYTAATLDGVLANPGPAIFRQPMLVSVTTSAVGAQYTLTAITITGTLYGVAQTDTITLTAAGGGEYLQTTKAFDTVTSIARLAMAGVGGQLDFGVHDLIFSNERPCRQVRHGSIGNIQMAFTGDGSAPYLDTTPGIEGERHDSLILRVYGDAAVTTSDPVTVYI